MLFEPIVDVTGVLRATTAVSDTAHVQVQVPGNGAQRVGEDVNLTVGHVLAHARALYDALQDHTPQVFRQPDVRVDLQLMGERAVE